MTFFERSYSQTYLRLMAIVAGMYQQYDGKETYFWQAQQLTNHDYDNSSAMMEAWLYVVSGLQDMMDSGRPSHELDIASSSIEVSDRAMVLYNIFNSVLFGAWMSPEKASEGLYVTTKPRLGLALV
jgi:hypothetical protein